MPGKNLSGGGSFYRQGGKYLQTNNGHKRNGSSESDNSGVSNGRYRNKENVAIRTVHKNRVKLDSYLADDENFPSFKAQLAKINLELRDIPADGNCLFRALGDQLEGHCRNHFRHRNSVVNFMRDHKEEFEPFLEQNISFDNYTMHLQKLGTHAGNDAIAAFAKLHSSIVVIHQLNGKPLMIQGASFVSDLTRQLHIAYHNGDHYSSVRKEGDNTESPALIRIEEALKMDNNSKFSQKQNASGKNSFQGGMVSARRGLVDIEHEVMLATNCRDIDQVRDSLMECDYDVDLAIADILQMLELSDNAEGDSASLASQQNSTDSGICPNSPTLSSNTVASSNDEGSNDSNNNNLANGNTEKGTEGVLKNNNGPSTNGKGHNVHFREDSFGGSSGYGSMNSKTGAKPKMLSERKTKEMKKQEKKRRAEEARRQKHLKSLPAAPGAPPHHPSVRDVTVVAFQDGRLTRM